MSEDSREMWQVAADAALSVEHEIKKAGLDISWSSILKINNIIRACVYADNNGRAQ